MGCLFFLCLKGDNQPQLTSSREKYSQLTPQISPEPLNFAFNNSLTKGQFEKLNTIRSSYLSSAGSLSDHGLPNIGNTCYLNSVLQLIYSATSLRESLIETSRSNSRLKFHSMLANILEDLKQKQPKSNKQGHLRDIVSFLSSKECSFALYNQNDIIQLFYAIFNSLQEEDLRKINRLNDFQITYEPKCLCTQEPDAQQYGPVSSYFVKIGQSCSDCKKRLKYKVSTTGRYLIVLPSSGEKEVKEYIKMVDKDSFMHYFECKGFITYYGNGDSGHYISHRKDEGRWLQISDSSVRLCNNLDRPLNPTFIMYEFLHKIQAKA